MYTDSDIQDLFKDLRAVGLAETPLEMAERGQHLIGKHGPKTMEQAAQILTEHAIPYELWSIGSADSRWDCLENFLLVSGFRLACDQEVTGFLPCSYKNLESMVEIKRHWKSLDYVTTSEVQVKTVKELPKPFMRKL